MTRTGQPRAAPESRFLLRRALAFVIDHTLAVLVVGAATLPFVGAGLRLPSPLVPLRTQTCTTIDAAPDWLIARAAGDAFSVIRLCDNRLYGLPDGREVIAVIGQTPRDDGTRVARFLRQPVRADLSPAPALPGLPALLALVLMGFSSALMTRAGWSSPGKALMRLRLEGPPRRAFAREALRLGPLAVFPLVTLASGFGVIAPPLLWHVGTVVAMAASGSLFLVWYYGVTPWRRSGPIRHDRLTGYRLRHLA